MFEEVVALEKMTPQPPKHYEMSNFIVFLKHKNEQELTKKSLLHIAFLATQQIDINHLDRSDPIIKKIESAMLGKERYPARAFFDQGEELKLQGFKE